jgi:hypothetical protein
MRDNFGKLLFGGIALLVVLVVGCCAAWLTHVITCLLVGKWGFLLAGAFLFPIAIIHGVMIWFGYGY